MSPGPDVKQEHSPGPMSKSNGQRKGVKSPPSPGSHGGQIEHQQDNEEGVNLQNSSEEDSDERILVPSRRMRRIRETDAEIEAGSSHEEDWRGRKESSAATGKVKALTRKRRRNSISDDEENVSFEENWESSEGNKERRRRQRKIMDEIGSSPRPKSKKRSAGKSRPGANVEGKRKTNVKEVVQDTEDDESVDGNDAHSRRKRTAVKGKRKEVEDESPEIYDEYWDKQDEEELQNGWSERDKELMKKFNVSSESALWKKCFSRFGMSPLELLGSIPVDTSSNTMEEEDWKHDIWAHNFCVEFGSIICCPISTDRPEYLCYVFRYVLFLRVGEREGFGKPKKSSIGGHRNRGIVERLKADSKYQVDEEALNSALDEYLGIDKAPYMEFLEDLKLIFRTTKTTVKKTSIGGLIKDDMVKIITAWNTHAGQTLGLKTMAEYRKEWDDKLKGRASKDTGKKSGRSAMEGEKKKCVLNQLRIAKREEHVARQQNDEDEGEE